MRPCRIGSPFAGPPRKQRYSERIAFMPDQSQRIRPIPAFAAKPERSPVGLPVDRRTFLAGFAGTATVAGLHWPQAFAQRAGAQAANLARVATASSLTATSENKIDALNDGFDPESSRDRKNGSYAVRRGFEKESTNAEWVQ